MRAVFLKQQGIREDACLSAEQHKDAMLLLRRRFFEREAVDEVYKQHAQQLGLDMAQRKRRSLFRSEMRRCLGHAVIADVLLIKGYWSQHMQDRLTEERGHQHTAGGPAPCAPLPSIHRTPAGRRKTHGPQKNKKRERYYRNLAVRLKAKQEEGTQER